jgi:hypothetical protein
MRVNGTDLYLTRGDSHTFTITCYENDEKIDLVSGDKVYMTVKKSVETETKEFQILVESFTNGSAEIEILPVHTKTMRFGSYVYDIQINFLSGRVSTIIKPSKFVVEVEVTYE